MLGEQRDHLLDPLAGTGLDEARDLEVLLGAHGPGQHLVGRVADQRVLERKLGLAGKRNALAGDDDVLVPQRPQCRGEVSPLGRGDRGQGALPERPPDHGGVSEQATLEGLERVQACRQQRLDGRGQLGGVRAFLLRQAPNHLLGEQRVALRARRHRSDDAAVGAGDVHQRGDQLARLAVAERLEEHSRRVASHASPASAAREQLFSGEADLQHGRAHPLHQMLDQVEHPLVGPVNVLPHEHQGALAREPFDACAHGREEHFPGPLCVFLLPEQRLVGPLDPEQPTDDRCFGRRGSAVGCRDVEQLADPRRQLVPRRRGRITVGDAALGTNHLAERPVDDARPVRKAASVSHQQWRVAALQIELELAQQA